MRTYYSEHYVAKVQVHLYEQGVNEFAKTHTYRIYPRAVVVSAIDNIFEIAKYPLGTIESIAMAIINGLGALSNVLGFETISGYQTKGYSFGDVLLCLENSLGCIAQIAIKTTLFVFNWIFQSVKIMNDPLKVYSINSLLFTAYAFEPFETPEDIEYRLNEYKKESQKIQ